MHAWSDKTQKMAGRTDGETAEVVSHDNFEQIIIFCVAVVMVAAGPPAEGAQN